MLHLFRSNYQENLVDALSQVLKKQPLPPLKKEIIVVQSQGMSHWLALQLAQRLGIVANSMFQFPVDITEDIFRRVLGDLPEPSVYQADNMTWALLTLLNEDSLLAQPAFKTLRDYLRQDAGLKRYQLAQRIAHLFDQYIIYRPEMILAWEKGDDVQVKNTEHQWQALLWQQLYAQNNHAPHRAHLQQQFLHKINQSDLSQCHLPQRLSVFGISALPPFYTEIFARLGEVMTVNLFVMDPCRHYWGDIIADSDMARQSQAHAAVQDPLAQQHYTSGNTLLASMGKLGRDFIDSLNDYNPVETDCYQTINPRHLLAQVQDQILNLSEGAPNGQKTPISATDSSLQIHCCHSPMREVEVLHDQLLALFEADNSLSPSDIVVMMPELGNYAPLIQTVFGNQSPAIPYHIVDREWQSESQVIQALMAIVCLADSRVTLSEVLDILTHEPIQQRFGLSDGQRQQIQTWLQQAGVRWGKDAASRKAQDLPEFNQNSWDFGLSRLLLGYVWATQNAGDNDLYCNIAPLDAIAGQQDSQTFAQFLSFSQQLFDYQEQLQQNQTPQQWQTLLGQILDDFFPNDNHTVLELRALRQLIEKLNKHSQSVACALPVSISVIRQWLKQNLDIEHIPQSFLSGDLTFCAMLPMRSIPFKIIALLGMNDRIYPRVQKKLRFDLLAEKPRRGDRSRRNDDRYLFLESLLSARDGFYISYVGQSIADNSESPPSVLVGELLDYLKRHFTLPVFVVKHRLQAFHPLYFQAQSPLFSYASARCQLSWQNLQPKKTQVDFIQTPLPAPETAFKQLNLKQLQAFYRHPARYLLRQRLHLHLPQPQVLLDDHETLLLNNLENYQLKQQLLHKKCQQQPTAAYQQWATQAGILPPLAMGQYSYRQIQPVLHALWQKLQPYLDAPPLAAKNAVFLGDDLLLSANFNPVYPHGLLYYRPATIKSNDLIDAWLAHLLGHCVADYPKTAVIIGIDNSYQFTAVDNAKEQLQRLLRGYWQGLLQPLPFFPQTSRAYAESIRNKKSVGEAMKAAYRQWENDHNMDSEKQDPYFAHAFRQPQPLNQHFAQLALDFWLPLLQHLTPL